MIVSDSTALITLINIDEFEILKYFAQQIIIPIEVYDEVSVKKKEPSQFLDTQIDTRFVAVMPYSDQSLFDELHILLDCGESASIVLASERRLPLLIDEKKGRRVAQNMGIEIVGLIGIVRFLYQNGQISKKRTKRLLEKLDASNFRISKNLIDLVLAR